MQLVTSLLPFKIYVFTEKLKLQRETKKELFHPLLHSSGGCSSWGGSGAVTIQKPASAADLGPAQRPGLHVEAAWGSGYGQCCGVSITCQLGPNTAPLSPAMSSLCQGGYRPATSSLCHRVWRGHQHAAVSGSQLTLVTANSVLAAWGAGQVGSSLLVCTAPGTLKCG